MGGDAIFPEAPVLLSSTVVQAQDGDIELLVAAPGDLVQIEMQSFTTRVGAVTNVEHNNFPPSATITSCLEGTSIAPFSPSVYCTRRFS